MGLHEVVTTARTTSRESSSGELEIKNRGTSRDRKASSGILSLDTFDEILRIETILDILKIQKSKHQGRETYSYL